jgi:copper oxidase (laccase) domain-containing protein
VAVGTPTFQPLSGVSSVRAAFVPRIAGIDVDADRETALARLAPAHQELLRRDGFDPATMATAEQIHGAAVAVAREPGLHAGADSLITAVPGLALGIYVADCAAVYLADRRGRAIGLVHSGRAGTTANITGRTIGLIQAEFGVAPEDLVVHLSPCIRPPLYETDFAADIAAQAREAGVGEIIDDGICTGRENASYYSYRVERGRTGRMLAALALLS